MAKWYDMATIPETAKRLREDGYNVADCALRRFVKDGNIPAVYSGKKALIYYPNVIKFLNAGFEPPHSEPQPPTDTKTATLVALLKEILD